MVTKMGSNDKSMSHQKQQRRNLQMQFIASYILVTNFRFLSDEPKSAKVLHWHIAWRYCLIEAMKCHQFFSRLTINFVLWSGVSGTGSVHAFVSFYYFKLLSWYCDKSPLRFFNLTHFQLWSLASSDLRKHHETRIFHDVCKTRFYLCVVDRRE